MWGVETLMFRQEINSTLFMQEGTQHIGKHIKEYMTQNGIKISWLAQQLGCHRNNIYLIFSRPWIDTDTLMKISQILQHDFFEDLSRWYKQK